MQTHPKYSDALLAHFDGPRNVWNDSVDETIEVISINDGEKGDHIQLYIKFFPESRIVDKCWFRSSGSIETIGISSWVTVFSQNKSLSEIISGLELAARKELDLSPAHWHITKWLKEMFKSLNVKIES